MEELTDFYNNVMNAETAHFCSESYKRGNQQKYTEENIARWKKEFKKSLDTAIKDGKFRCLVSVPQQITPAFVDIPKEECYGLEIFMEWLKEKGYKVKVDMSWLVIGW